MKEEAHAFSFFSFPIQALFFLIMNSIEDIFRALKAGVTVRGADLVKQVSKMI